ncbi:MAG: transglutaminase-like domain-containing protein, partial [Candidatus Woesearchaeota archaeon]
MQTTTLDLWKRELTKYSYDLRSTHYALALFDESIQFPATIDKGLIKKVNHHFLQIPDQRTRAKEIFSYLSKNIRYGQEKQVHRGYRNAEEVLKLGEGVCGEMSYVYVVAARLSGLTCTYMHVDIDYQGKHVNHACAGVYAPNLIQVDIAYNS